MKRVLGDVDDHPWTLENMANLADTYRGQGYLDEAVVLQETVLEKRKQALREGHPDIVKSMWSLVATYRDLGRINDAEALEATVEENKKRDGGS